MGTINPGLFSLIVVKERGHYEVLDVQSGLQFGRFSTQHSALSYVDKLLDERNSIKEGGSIMDGWSL